MVTLTLRSPFCTSDFLIKYGITPNGKQRYRCQACSRQHREHPGSNAYAEAARAMILRTYEEWSRLRGLSRTFGVARNTVSAWLKKSPELAATGNDRKTLSFSKGPLMHESGIRLFLHRYNLDHLQVINLLK